MKHDPARSASPTRQKAYNGLCLCEGKQTCINCVFCLQHHTPQGRKALAATIVNFLVFTPVYQHLVEETLPEVFPKRIVYEDEKELASMLFEAVTFEGQYAGYTPFAYFLTHAPCFVSCPSYLMSQMESRPTQYSTVLKRVGIEGGPCIVPG
jgi:hypothetical protein